MKFKSVDCSNKKCKERLTQDYLVYFIEENPYCEKCYDKKIKKIEPLW